MPLRLAVIGHVEHVTMGRVPAMPAAGDIAHMSAMRSFPGGGGGLAFGQLARSPAEVHFFTALGGDEAGDAVQAWLARTPGDVHVHAVRRDTSHNRAVVLVTPDGERTIIVVGPPLHPEVTDPLPWDLLARCDGVYFTAQDPETLRAARAARRLVATARRREFLLRSGVRADVVVGSVADARERSELTDYPVAPGALVLTEGARGGRIETAEGVVRFSAPPRPPPGGVAYGAGDSFAAALTFFLAAGLPILDACTRAGPHGAAVLRGEDPLAMQLPLEI